MSEGLKASSALVLLEIIQPDDDSALLDLVTPVESAGFASGLVCLGNLRMAQKRHCLLARQAKIKNSMDQLPLLLEQLDQPERLDLAVNHLNAIHE